MASVPATQAASRVEPAAAAVNSSSNAEERKSQGQEQPQPSERGEQHEQHQHQKQQQPEQSTSSPYGGDDASECPICKFIEAGPCRCEHEAWVKCRHTSQEEGTEFVEACKEQFQHFFECMLTHRGYYQPFLEMFGGALSLTPLNPEPQAAAMQEVGEVAQMETLVAAAAKDGS